MIVGFGKEALAIETGMVQFMFVDQRVVILTIPNKYTESLMKYLEVRYQKV